MRNFASFTSTLVWLFVLGTGWSGAAAPNEEAFKLKEFSVFDETLANRSDFLMGQRAYCETSAPAALKQYPSFKSKKPLYGSVRFATDYQRPEAGRLYYFALDESGGTGKGYDRLYFDLKQDLNLANDAPLAKCVMPNEGQLPWSNLETQTAYDTLKVEFDFGSGGVRLVEIVPRLVVWREGGAALTFVSTKVHQGWITLGAKGYVATLGHDHVIAGRFDHPATALRLEPRDERGGRIYWWGSDRLTAMHKVGTKFYSFVAAPTGDQLTVRVYEADLGTFAIGPGDRKLSKMKVSGSLEGLQRGVAVGGELNDSSVFPPPAPSCQLPVGDYLPALLTIHYGPLRISVSQNYHADGKPRDRGGRPPVYGIKIRKDQPFYLDFSNKPTVMFASPAKAQRYKPGETVMAKAVLIDPVLDIMIRGLDDTTQTVMEERDIGGGNKRSYPKTLSLDPKVVISRANGEKVAEGVMPFG